MTIFDTCARCLPLRWLAAAWLMAALLLPATGPGWGQQVTAAVTGKITDPSGASVADAKITATDLERGTVWPSATNAVYDVPIGRARAFGRNMNKVADALIGGWQASGILSLHTGFPLTVNAADASGTGSRGARADCIAPPDVLREQNSALGGYQWYNPASYTQPAAVTFGSCGVGTVRGPGLHTMDFDLTKNFKFTERQNLDLRADFINLTNTPILNSPSNGIGTTLGLLQSSQGARNVQFSLKYHF
jgi:hypothetical protein